MDMIQDWMIINKIKMGDPDAWDILVHKYYDSVYFYCVRRCYGDCDIASDLTQDIFLKLVESLPRYRFIGKFQNYLYTMAVNTCNNYLKKRHIEQIELTDNFTTDLDTSLIDEILHDERKETVQKALDLLPEIQREVVILRYYHDLKVKDIATITGVGVSTVQSRIYQGLVMQLVGIGFVESVTLLISALMHSSMSVLAVSLGVYILPLLLVQMIKTGVGNKILYLFPINNLNVQNILGILYSKDAFFFHSFFINIGFIFIFQLLIRVGMQLYCFIYIKHWKF